MRGVGQVLVLTSQANYKGNLKNMRTYLQWVQPLSLPEPQLCVASPTQDRSWLRTIYPSR
jgi:aminoglycoside phosphotransferase